MINTYEADYLEQWNKLPNEFRLKMLQGIVAFEVEVSELQTKKKLSQNKTEAEKQKIIGTLSQSHSTSEQLIAKFMKEQEALAL